MPSILVKLPNWMGDILFSYDLLFTLSRHFDRVGLCTSSQMVELFEVYPIPNGVVVDYPPENWPYLDRDSVLKIEKFGADVGLLLPNSFGSALAMRYAGVSKLYGYDTEYRGILLEGSLPVQNHKVHQTEYYLKLLQLFGLTAQSYPVAESPAREKLVIIHPGASKPPRAWALQRFMRVAEAIQARGIEVTFVSGETIPAYPFLCLVRPSLKDFAGLLKRASLFIGNDSGPLHLAQQSGAPVVGIYGPGDPMVTGPRGISPHRVVYHAFPCSPCRQKFFEECEPAPSDKPFCIETITEDEVLKAAFDLLGSPS